MSSVLSCSLGPACEGKESHKIKKNMSFQLFMFTLLYFPSWQRSCLRTAQCSDGLTHFFMLRQTIPWREQYKVFIYTNQYRLMSWHIVELLLFVWEQDKFLLATDLHLTTPCSAVTPYALPQLVSITSRVYDERLWIRHFVLLCVKTEDELKMCIQVISMHTLV